MSSDQTFDEVKARLDEIAEAVAQEGISLDEALGLYEEAVRLGLEACDLSEADVSELLEEDDMAPEIGATSDDQTDSTEEAFAEVGADATAVGDALPQKSAPLTSDDREADAF